MSEGVILIRLLLGHTEAYERYERRSGIGQVVERIRRYGDSSAYYSRKKLYPKKQDIEDYTQRSAKLTVSSPKSLLGLPLVLFYKNLG